MALCDLALISNGKGNKEEAQGFLDRAMDCRDGDRLVTIRAALECDIGTGTLRQNTTSAIDAAFENENVDPELLLRVLQKSFGDAKAGKDNCLDNTTSLWNQWESAARKSLFTRTVSHFYRELDDYTYLAPRIRRGFMEAADGQFLALGDPLADLLDWTASIGEQLLNRIECFTPDHVEILKCHQVLGEWNRMLVSLSRLTSLLAARSNLLSGQFVSQLNIGLLELPAVYEDDKVVFEINSEEGDTFALTCYYAVFTRNGVEHFPVPLHDYSYLIIDTYEGRAGTKGVVVVDSRSGQTLVQGLTGSFQDAAGDEHYFIDLFVEAASLLSQVHEIMQWAINHEREIFSVFLLLNSLTERLAENVPASQGEEFEVVEENEEEEEFEIVNNDEDDDFEIVE